MRAIIRVAAEYGSQVVAAMGSAASIAGSIEELLQHAHNIANQWRNAQWDGRVWVLLSSCCVDA